MKKYTTPEVEVVKFYVEDVITASSGNDGGNVPTIPGVYPTAPDTTEEVTNPNNYTPVG